MKHVPRLPILASLVATSGAALLAACGGSENAAPAVPPPALAPSASAVVANADPGPAAALAPEHLDSDTTKATTRRTSFVGPSGWTLTARENVQILQAPEPALRIAIVEATAANADDAVKAAWAALEPTFAWKLKLADARPPRRGWDARRVYDYETSPNEKKVLSASALKHGDAFTVVLLDSSEEAAGKRGGQIRQVMESTHPSGYVKESFAGKTPNTLDPARVKRITDLFDRAREAAGVPGFALSLVQNGQVIFSGGFGTKELGKSDKTAGVDDDTLFMIASNTKALTTLLLAEEVDQGKFTWDTPATKVWPAFKLGDQATTDAMLMRYLVCACTGMPRQDYEWLFEFDKATPTSEMKMLGGMQPTSKFGEVFQYSNLLAAAAGFAGGYAYAPKKELGAAYDEALRTNVLKPLGMNETTFDFARALKGNHATPHASDVDGNAAIAPMNINRSMVPLRPAGGAWSSVEDLTKYVQMELANGKLPNGTQLVSEKNLKERQKPNAEVGEGEFYGMGLEVNHQYGIPVVHHGGSMIGFKSDMFWLPEQGVGGVILTNSDEGWNFLRPFVRKTLEELFDGKPEAADDLAANLKLSKTERGKERERLQLPASADSTSALATHYTNAALGSIAVTHAKGTDGTETTFDIGEWKARVASRKNDDGTVSLVTVEPGIDGLPFVVGTANGKRTLTLRDAQHEYVFTEK